MSQRIEKVQKLAREVLGQAVQNLKDPRVGFATVTAVRISPDLRHARVHVSVLGDEEQKKETMTGLERAKSHLRAVLGNEVRMKYTPELVFELDQQAEEAEHLEEIFRRIHEGGAQDRSEDGEAG